MKLEHLFSHNNLQLKKSEIEIVYIAEKATEILSSSDSHKFRKHCTKIKN